MAEFIASQSQDGQSKNSKSQQNQLLLLVKETQQNKALADKKQHYCAPGSISRYLQVTMSHGPKGQQSNDLNSHDTNVDLTLADESLRPQPQVNVSDEFEVSEDASQNQNHEANVPEAFQNESNESSVTKENKHRGRTILAHVHACTMEKRPPVLFNNLNQPVGPDKDILRDFSHLLGTLAKDSSFAPLNYVTWKYMPSSFKKKICDYVQKKFILEKEAKKYVLQNVNEKWRLHKTRVKEKYYKENETMEQRMAKRPEDIPENDFKELMEFWDLEKTKEISKKNKENRGKQKDMHTLGPKSLALLREEMKQNDPNNRVPSQADVYVESRKRNPGCKYLTTNEEALENIERMKALKTCEYGSINQDDPYHDVITKKEHSGRLRLYGLGVTKSSFKSKDPETPYKIPSVFLDHIKEQMEKEVAAQVEKTLAGKVEQKLSLFLSKIREANQGRDVDIPDLSTIQEEESSSNGNLNRDHVDESEGTGAI